MRHRVRIPLHSCPCRVPHFSLIPHRRANTLTLTDPQGEALHRSQHAAKLGKAECGREERNGWAADVCRASEGRGALGGRGPRQRQPLPVTTTGNHYRARDNPRGRSIRQRGSAHDAGAGAPQAPSVCMSAQPSRSRWASPPTLQPPRLKTHPLRGPGCPPNESFGQ